MNRAVTRQLELWAGAECTVNRVGASYFDQLQRTAHDARLADLERLAALGASRIRFPILWERTSPEGIAGGQGFDWSDVRLERLAALGIDPIVGLVHHGSGPPGTHLCDSGFAAGLSAFASRVAQRYPWVSAFTPVNEPLTTARFSALYGLWYPHTKDLAAFYQALVNEVVATREGMHAIRRINPGAELYVTEDVAQIFSTPDLDGQCRYENERRWLSLDLMFGRVDARHPLRRELEAHGITARLLDELSDLPCTPDLIGINYYVTSDRFLDSNLAAYPPETWGGNGRQTYADVEAVRARPEGILGHRAVLESVWARYQAPCAFTEVHLACHREDQLRWLLEAWRAAVAARATGVDVRAITIWSVFGAVGWNNLMTLPSGEYEPGAYDIRAPEPRPTALAKMAQSISAGEPVGPFATPGLGWWRSSARLLYGTSEPASDIGTRRPEVMVLGESSLTRRVAELCARRFDAIEVSTLASAGGALDAGARPWALFFAFDPLGPAPDLAAELDAHWAHIERRCTAATQVLALSSERVFDGWAERAYDEDDPPTALGDGGHWLAFEQCLIRKVPRALIVRSGLLMDPAWSDDPLARLLRALRQGRGPSLSEAELVSPTWMPDFVDVALDLLADGESGVWHLGPRTSCPAVDVARRLAECAGLPFVATQAPACGRSTRGPMHALASRRGWPIPDLETTLARAMDEYRRASLSET